jgi:hypothetical protein
VSIYRLTDFLLQVGTLVGTALALVYLFRIALATLLPIQWFWGSALASFSAPLAFAATRYFLVRTSGPFRTIEVPNA